MLPEQPAKTISVTHQTLMFNDSECQVMMFRDITSQAELRIAQEQNQMANLLMSSVTHEMLTPIRCIKKLS